MYGKFVVLVERDQHADIEEATASTVKAGSGPHSAPYCFSDVGLQGLTFCSRCALEGTSDVCIPEYLPTYLDSGIP
jgi:hypothetical protein